MDEVHWEIMKAPFTSSNFFRHLFMDPYTPRAIILCQPRIKRTRGSDSHTNDQLGLLTLIDSLGVEP